ncbi:ComEC/Rec2 family competence protein [Brachybacterium saurashtrense]|uniref:ComEC/Rec2 family competence protein n=1 Tax=Brachybacterium saurashtrense TaxID=556288 RepID=A0A345YMT1_9MICO|nr:ComEC/Rec2 family competence protein [Brachybacterium saurashtrense]AXK45233.1 ComEC/Rec2 family competence protein [Brachybacterium saurashtrense]RRR22013.1 ComEC/Rec2 family competence protein [Brachybacterium saurashtrense]
MTRADLRLLPGATCVWALAVLGVSAGTAAAIAGGAVLVALGLTAVMLAGPGSTSRGLFAHLGIVVLAAVLLFPALQRHGETDQALERAAADGLVVELTVVAAADPAAPESGPEWSRHGLQMRARTVSGPARTGRDEVRLPASLPVLVRAEDGTARDLSRVRDGDRARVRGRVATSGSLVIVRASEVHVVAGDGAAGRAQALRHGLREGARDTTAHLPADEAALVRGMTTGDTRGLSERSEEIMRRAGISHLVAVSGANIALVLAAVLGPLLLMGVRRRPRILAAGIVTAGYVGLVGDEPSVQRAATMAAPLLAARFAGVKASPVAALALTVALWSVLDPVTAASIGFLLSALATAAILVAAPPLATALVELSGQRVGRTAALVLAVPLVAQLACTPVLILLAPEVSLWSVPVNMAVAPLVGPTTVLGMVALLIGAAWPPAGALLWTAAAGGAHLVLLIARTADALPGARIAVPEGPAGVVLALGVLAGVTLAVAGRHRPLVRWAVAGVLVAALSAGGARLLPVRSAGEWTVAMCAVGQGDAVLLRPDGAGREGPTVLVDTGPDPEALRACLDRLQVASIDLLVLTHPHADHTGGRAALSAGRAPALQWTCPLPEAAQQVVPGAPVAVATTGETWRSPGLALHVLWPVSAEEARRAGAAERGGGEGDAANDCSVVVEAVWEDGTRLLALGDLEPAGQEALAASSPGPADIVKVAHHGSRFQHVPLYAQLDPALALIPVGRENDFGHPTQETLDLVRSTGAQVLRSDVHGTVVLPADGTAPRRVGPAR